MIKLLIGNKYFGLVKKGLKPERTVLFTNSGDERVCILKPVSSSNRFIPSTEYLFQDENGNVVTDENTALFDAVCVTLEPKFPPNTVVYSDADGFGQDADGNFYLSDLGFGIVGTVDEFGDLQILFETDPDSFVDENNVHFLDENGSYLIDSVAVETFVLFSDENNILFADEIESNFRDI